MKFMLMMHHKGTGAYALSGWTGEALQAHIQFMKELNRELGAAGELAEAYGLDHPSQAKLVRASPGAAPAVTDGPFAETKEFLVGYWIVDVPSRERAYEICTRISAAPGPNGRPLGIPVELREVMSAPS